MKTKIIFEASIHHTGTHFVRGLLTDSIFHSRSSYFGTIYVTDKCDEYGLVDSLGRHYVVGFEGLLDLIRVCLANMEKQREENIDIAIYHMHFGGYYNNEFIPISIMEGLIKRFDTIIPIRDPLLALLTAETRFPGMDHTHIVSGFHYLSQLDHETVSFFPIDLPLFFQQRKERIINLFTSFGIPISDEVLSAWSDFPVFGDTTGRKRFKLGGLKEEYHRGNLEEIIKVIPTEYAYLKAMEKYIRPFLESLGYEDLLWWQ